MSTSQNGWPVLSDDSHLLHTWVIPATTGAIRITLRGGSAGFLLCHFLLWYAETIEALKGRILDDWGHAVRPVRGQTIGYSNHASGTAADANAMRHPRGRVGTLGFKIRGLYAAARIHTRLALYRAAIRWGGEYHGRKDEMHYEINVPLPTAERVARSLLNTSRGRRLLAANPGQRAVILS